MIDKPLESPTAPASRDWRDRPPFTATHRAQAICLREVQRLSDEIAKVLRAQHKAGEIPALVVAQAPGRLMVQLGPVALTIAWLRGSLDNAADGQLMVVYWEGVVVHGTRRIPERAPVAAAASARTIAEENYVVVAEDEASWRWHAAVPDDADLTTSELAERCIARLFRVHADHLVHA